MTKYNCSKKRISNGTKLIKHKLGVLETFELTEYDLDKLGDNKVDYMFDFSLPLLSFGGAIFISMYNSHYDPTVKPYFVVVMWVCIIGGLVLLVIWFQNRKWREKYIKQIKERNI